MISRKHFLKNTLLVATGFPLLNRNSDFDTSAFTLAKNTKTTSEAVNDEAFWKTIRAQYVISKDVINLNNGGVSPQPIPVQKAHIKNYEFSNEVPTYTMWRQLDKGREPLRQQLAEMLGCDAEEIAINRNTTEGLNTIISGLPLTAGDEVVLTKYDYPNMINAWKQRAKREGIILRWVDLSLPEENDEAIVAKFAAQINAATKVVHITHVVNWSGQILPVQKIANYAKSNGCEVIVDGAHSFAQLNFKISELNCDYFASSLHKWLCAPFGTGILYVKQKNIAKVWPLTASYESQVDDIRKFEVLGTRSFAAEMAISEAINFHELMGTTLKEERLRYLKNYWLEKVKLLQKVKTYTSLKNQYSCAIATIGIEGLDASEIELQLLEKYKIHCTIVKHEQINGIRITPHVYTSISELDLLVNAIKEMAS
jgi:selenocysteine lyase/cysteine desulfurase